MAQPSAGGALSGLRVLNLGSSLSAAWCARTLADYGADATTVEPPGGTALRRLGPLGPDGESIPAAYALSNQRSLILDLARDADRAALRRLAADSDVVLESRAPGVLDDAGASFEELCGERPGLILAALTPHGLTGPRAGQAGNDLTAFARSGWAANQRARRRAAAQGRASCRLALRRANGRGGGAGGPARARLERARATRRPRGDGRPRRDVRPRSRRTRSTRASWSSATSSWFRDPLQGPLPAADGYFHLMLGRSDFFRLALHILGLPELAEDARFESRAARLELAEEWVPSVRERVAAREKLELFEALTSARVVAGPVLDAAEIAANEHLAARGFFVQPEGGGPRMPGPAARLSATPPRLRRPAPAPGADDASLLREARERDAPTPRAAARSRPLEGLRALALTQVWAGAHCAQQLALLGAEVIKIEARRRPDTWRGGYEMRILAALQDRPTARRGWNCHPSFNSGNLNQLGVTLDLQRPEGIRLFPPAAALDRHRRRELHAARPRQPRDRLRGDA